MLGPRQNRRDGTHFRPIRLPRPAVLRILIFAPLAGMMGYRMAETTKDSPKDAATPPSGPTDASQYWAGNLDPQNLEVGEESQSGISLEDEIRFAWSPETRAAFAWLRNGEPPPEVVVDLGAGLGAASLAMARRGVHVICVDTSIDRMRHLLRRATAAGCREKITPVVGACESLPFADDSVRALFTKSVLIHTDLPTATLEVARVLGEAGRAAFVEPQPGNPFAWLYRNTLAPKAWKSITRYFGPASQEVAMRPFTFASIDPFYLFGFLPFVFQYAWPKPGLFEAALRVTEPIDRWLFRVRPCRMLAWFGVIEVEKATPKVVAGPINPEREDEGNAN